MTKRALDGILAPVLPMVDPMLATQGIPTDRLDRYACEPKLDGWRVTVGIEPGSVTIRTRRGRNITDQLPEFSSLRELGLSAVLDGELVANAGRAGDFYRVAPAVAARRRGSLTVVAFDLLWLDGKLMIDETYQSRRARLDALDLGPALTVVQSWDGMTAPYLFAACEEHGVEGIVLKRRTSAYRPGERSLEWRKVKTRHWFEKHALHRRPR